MGSWEFPGVANGSRARLPMHPFPRWIGTPLVRLLLTPLLLLLLGPSSTTAQQPAFLTNGLVAYYPFNGNANDESGKGNNGRVVGNVSFAADRFGIARSASEFAGDPLDQTRGVWVDSKLFNYTNSYSITLWFISREESLYDQHIITSVPDGALNFLFNSKFNFLPNISFGFGPTTLDTFGNSKDSRVWGGVSRFSADFKKWNQASLVKDANLLTVYFNGVKLAELSNPGPLEPRLPFGFRIGGNNDGGITGGIDDVRFYNRALSSAEVLDLYKLEAPQPPSITTQPLSQTVEAGEPVTLATSVLGAAPLSYQWFKDGNPLPGATNDSLNFPKVQPPHIGDYWMVVANASGSVTSSIASINIRGVDPAIWKGLVAYYIFNKNTVDSSVWENDLKVVGQIEFSEDRYNLRNTSSSFRRDVTNGLMLDRINGLNTNNNSEVTISFWSRNIEETTYDEQWSSVNGVPTVYTTTYLTQDPGIGVVGFHARNRYFRIHCPSPSQAIKYIITDSDLKYDSWVLVTVTAKLNVHRIFINGNLVSESYANNWKLLPDKPIYIGCVPWNLNSSASVGKMAGEVDDFRIYSRALSDSDVATLYESERVPNTVITAQPQGVVAVQGSEVTLSVVVANPSPLVTLTYQWQKDGNLLPGATNAVLKISNVQPVNIGDYQVVVSGGFAPVTSSVASLQIEGVNSGIWKGLVAWYPFDGNSEERIVRSGGEIDSGVTWIADRFGTPSASAAFMQVDSNISRPAIGLPTGSLPRTFSVWYKPLNSSFLNRAKDDFTNLLFYYGDWNTNNLAGGWSFQFYVRPDKLTLDGGCLGLGIRNPVDATDGYLQCGGGIAVDEEWHHVALVYPGSGSVLIYHDGKGVQWLPNSVPPVLNTIASRFWIGGTSWGASFRGALDDFRIYDRALLVSDIEALYESERVPDTVITTQPQGVTAVEGSEVTLSVVASNPSPLVTLTYQWQKDGNPLPGATNAVLKIPNVQPVNIGDYQVVVTGGFGPVTSATASVGIDGVRSGVWRGLVAWYLFDGGIDDGAKSGHHAKGITKILYGKDRFGRFGQSLECAPVNGGVIGPSSAIPDKSDFSLSFWLRVDPLVLNQSFDQTFFALPQQQYGIRVRHDLYTQDGFRDLITIVQPWNSERFIDYRGSWFSGWFQLVVVVQNRSIFTYIGGNLASWVWDSAPGKTSLLTELVSEDFRLGSWGGYSGRVDDFRIYNRALSAADVAALYESERVPDTVITRQPQSVTVAVGGSVQLSVEASNPIPTVPLAYQWFKDGAPLPGATQALLDLGTLQLEEIGAYSVTVDDGSRTITSAVATVNLQGVDPAIWKGLIASYPLDGSYRDVSGFGDELVPYGSVELVGVGHRPESGAVRTRGVDGFLVGPDRSWFSGKAPRTVSVWFKPDGTAATPSTLLNLGGLVDCGQRFALQVPAAQNGLRFDAGDCTNGLRSRTFTGGSVAGKWTHAVLTYDGSSVRAYVNGLASGTAYAVELATDAAAPLVLGNMVGVDGEGFAGWLDDVRVYNRALSATEVRSLYNFENSGTTPSLPQITRQPQPVQGYEGETLRLSVEASGFQIGYRWQREEQDLVGGDRVQGVGSAELVIRRAVVADAGGYRVVVTNVFGTVTSAAVRVSVEPPIRVLAAGTALEVQEGGRLTFPLSLSSPGDVGGLTFKLVYNPAFLADPQLEWSAAVGQSVNSVNVGTPGEISAAFSLAGQALASGTNPVATVSFRARSVPGVTNVALAPVIVSAGSPTGAILSNGNGAIPGEGRVLPRKIRGDNNANQRIDVGDAVVISRLQVGLEEVRPWDVPLNDLNDTGSIDNGDVIRALRIVVGLDLQPKAAPQSGGEWSVESGALRVETAGADAPEGVEGTGGAVSQLSTLNSQLNARRLRPAGANTNDVATLEFPDGPVAQAGKPYRVVVKMTRAGAAIAGLSFTVNYPSALTLTDKQVGALVPADALPLWAESVGSVNLAAVRSTIWPTSTGVASVLTFLPTAGISAQATWPIELVKGEVTGAGFDIRALDTVVGEIRSTSTPPTEPKVVVPTLPMDGGPLALDVEAAAGAAIVLETTTDLGSWSEAQRLTGQGAGKPVRVTVTPDPNARARFWRVRVP